MITRMKLLSGILTLHLVMALTGCGVGEKPAVAEKAPAFTTAPTESAAEATTQSTDPSEKIVAQIPTVTTPSQVKEVSEETKPSEPPMETVPETEPTPPETEPVETVPPVTEPNSTAPPAIEPPVTEPTQTAPPVTEPEPSEPTPTETEPEVTESTEPPAEIIDTAALESYGRSYASSTYGYSGTSACHPGTGAGYFPAATKVITSMEEGRQYVREAVDSQYKRDMAYGYLPYEEIDGVTVRCPINVSVDSVGDNTYTITVYYGGTA